MKSKKRTTKKVVPIREGIDAFNAFLHSQGYGRDRNRAYTGQRWTMFGARGQVHVKNRTYRDVGDALALALMDAMRRGDLTFNGDMEALIGECLLRVEKFNGVHPCDEPYRHPDEPCPTCNQPWKIQSSADMMKEIPWIEKP